MPQPEPSPPTPAAQTFAGLLAAFAAPKASPGQKRPPARDLGGLGGLGDDVATLSYERALRAHARYHAPEPLLQPSAEHSDSKEAAPAPPPVLAQAEGQAEGQAEEENASWVAEALRAQYPRVQPSPAADPFDRHEPLQLLEYDAPGESVHAAAQAEEAETARPAAEAPPAFAVSPAASETGEMRQGRPAPVHADAWPGVPWPASLERNLKTASITIRLSQEECAQLRKRAAEAGLTVSAYMRSCTFETEALRALVKDTLAKMRSDASHAEGARSSGSSGVHQFRGQRLRGQRAQDESGGAQAGARQRAPGWWEWLARLWPSARVSHPVGQA